MWRKLCIYFFNREPDSRRFNEKIAMESGGRLAPADMAPLRFATISGSHCNMAARTLLHGAAVGNHTIGNIAAPWRKAIHEGTEWQVIKRIVVTTFPTLVEMICQSANTLQAVAKPEDEMQVMMKILAMVKNSSAPPMWKDLAPHILRSRPKCGPAASEIFGWVLKFGGSEKLVEATEKHVRNFGRSGRELGGEVWATLSQDVKALPSHLRWRHMLLKFAYCNADRPLSVTDAAWQKKH